MVKYYLDTSIWMDIYENRKGYFGEPLGEFGIKLISLILNKKSKIIISDLLIIELKINYSIEEINGMFKLFEKQIEKIVSSEEQQAEATKLAKERNLPRGDALHAILARDNNYILITRDKHFKQLKDIAITYKPEEII